MFVCAYTPRHANFKITWTDFSSLWTFSPVQKVEFCSWCWRCAAWPKTWNGEGRIYSSHNWLLREILTRWPGNSSEQSICLPNVFIHQCPIHLLHARRNPTVPLMCIPEQHSCQVHWGDTFLDTGVTQHLKSYRRCHVLAFSCVILVTLTPPLQSEMSVSLHLVPNVAWAYISL